MSKFEIGANVGSYNSLPRLKVKVEIDEDVTEEDYKVIRDAIRALEDMVRSYVPVEVKK